MFPCRKCGRVATNAESHCASCGHNLKTGPKVTSADAPPPIINDPVSLGAILAKILASLIAGEFLFWQITLTIAVVGFGWAGFQIANVVGMMVAVIIVFLAVIIIAAVREHRHPKPPTC